MPDPHAFTPDLLGDCARCPLPAGNPVHDEPILTAYGATTATESDEQPVPGGFLPPGSAGRIVAVPWTDGSGRVDMVRLTPETHARTSDPDTSHAAAVELSDKATMMRTLLRTYAAINTPPDEHGLTAEEAVTIAGYSAEDGAWKRVSDLKAAGWIEPTGTTRPGSSGRQQAVCRITDAGRQALR